MINQLFTFPSTIKRLREGPLGEHLDAYAIAVARQGYAQYSILSQIRAVTAFGRWLQQKRIEIRTLDRKVMDRFLRHRERQQEMQHGDPRTLNRFLAMLCQMGVVKSHEEQPAESPTQRIMNEFGRYLTQDRRLSPSTSRNYVPTVGKFLFERFQNRTANLSAIRAIDVTSFVQRHAHELSHGRAKLMVTALRSFFRYLQHRGEVSADLAASVPAVPNWSFSSVPRFLPASTVQRVLDRCDRRAPVGKRNYAILLLLARLGLRAGEVAGLNLEDIDWTAGLITVRGKGGRSASLPLTVDVGEAIAMYLRDARPHCSSRRVFIRHRAPFIGFATSMAISSIAMRSLNHAGVDSAHKGAHVFRHSLATSLLRKGCSLDEIGELLRHQSPNTTAIYAKVDLSALRSLALPWPGARR